MNVTRGQVARQVLIVLGVCAILLAPIIVYIATFGWRISADHERWAQMGSAMSGIYSPLLALLALLLLVGQVRAQQAMNKHHLDNVHIEKVRTDLREFLSLLSPALHAQGPIPGQPLIQSIRKHFESEVWSKEELEDSSLADLALAFHGHIPQVADQWTAIYTLLAGLHAVPADPPYELQAAATVHAMVSAVGFPTAVALDNYVYSLSRDRVIKKYMFSVLAGAER